MIEVQLHVVRKGKTIEKRKFGPFLGMSQTQDGMWVVKLDGYPRSGPHEANSHFLRSVRRGWIANVGWVPFDEREKVWNQMVITEVK